MSVRWHARAAWSVTMSARTCASTGWTRPAERATRLSSWCPCRTVRAIVRCRRIATLACLASCSPPPTRPEAPATEAARIDHITHNLLPPARIKGEDWHTNLDDRMREHHVHGLGIAVFEHYRLRWVKGFGLADAETKQPVTETTLFQAGSISKAVNALAVLEAVEQGKLALDTPINESLRSWKLGDNELT